MGSGVSKGELSQQLLQLEGALTSGLDEYTKAASPQPFMQFMSGHLARSAAAAEGGEISATVSRRVAETATRPQARVDAAEPGSPHADGESEQGSMPAIMVASKSHAKTPQQLIREEAAAAAMQKSAKGPVVGKPAAETEKAASQLVAGRAAEAARREEIVQLQAELDKEVARRRELEEQAEKMTAALQMAMASEAAASEAKFAAVASMGLRAEKAERAALAAQSAVTAQEKAAQAAKAMLAQQVDKLDAAQAQAAEEKAEAESAAAVESILAEVIGIIVGFDRGRSLQVAQLSSAQAAEGTDAGTVTSGEGAVARPYQESLIEDLPVRVRITLS